MKIIYCISVLLTLVTVVYSKNEAPRKVNTNVSASTSFLLTRADSVINAARNLVEKDYSIPTWTLLKRALKGAVDTPDSPNIRSLELAMANLKSKNTPYSVIMTLNGDPTSRMGFAWYTNQGVAKGKVQLVAGNTATVAGFTASALSFDANSTNFTTNYCVAANGLLALAGFADNSTRSYSNHKAIVTGLRANTTYLFRVGTAGAWSETGSFITAKAGKDAFSFIYFTDPQAATDEMFDISQKTLHKAKAMYPNANFALTCGDLVETSGPDNSEWEYEQFFLTQQDIWNTTPLAPIMGNHDYSENRNFTRHFNTPVTNFDKNMATVPGSVYSFVYGDALFMAMDFEENRNTAYLDSLRNWIIQQTAAHHDVKWKIAFFHLNMYSGGGHQPDRDQMIVRDYFTPVFDSLKIDLALEGHDHVYEVMGPLKGKALVPNAVSNQVITKPQPYENMTGRSGGRFDVTQGTLYFVNNSSGQKKYQPITQAKMAATETSLGISDYFSFFTGRLGQTSEPTFSNISVSSDSIVIATHALNVTTGVAYLFDKFRLVKTDSVASNKSIPLEGNVLVISPNPVKTQIRLTGSTPVQKMELYALSGKMVSSLVNQNQLNVALLPNGVYILKVTWNDNPYVGKVIIDN